MKSWSFLFSLAKLITIRWGMLMKKSVVLLIQVLFILKKPQITLLYEQAEISLAIII